jgi:hypothetical protein
MTAIERAPKGFAAELIDHVREAFVRRRIM